MDEIKIKIKQNREFDQSIIIRAICFYLICVGALLVICIFTGSQLLTYKHLFIFSLCAIPVTILFSFFVERLGHVLGGTFYGWTTKKITPREQLSADLEKARYSKRNRYFDEALDIIDGVLDKDKDFPDALYLKGQILWEGFGISVESKNCFRKVRFLVSPDDPLYRWSSDYIDKIMEKDKMTVDEFMSKGRGGQDLNLDKSD